MIKVKPKEKAVVLSFVSCFILMIGTLACLGKGLILPNTTLRVFIALTAITQTFYLIKKYQPKRQDKIFLYLYGAVIFLFLLLPFLRKSADLRIGTIVIGLTLSSFYFPLTHMVRLFRSIQKSPDIITSSNLRKQIKGIGLIITVLAGWFILSWTFTKLIK